LSSDLGVEVYWRSYTVNVYDLGPLFQDGSGYLGERLKGKDLKRKSIRAEAKKTI